MVSVLQGLLRETLGYLELNSNFQRRVDKKSTMHELMRRFSAKQPPAGCESFHLRERG